MRNCASKNTDQMLRWHCFLKSLWARFVQQLSTEQLHFTHEVEGVGEKTLLELHSFHAELQRLSWSSPGLPDCQGCHSDPPHLRVPARSNCHDTQEAWAVKELNWQTHSSLTGRHLKIQSYLMSLPEIPPLESISPKVIMLAQWCQPW